MSAPNAANLATVQRCFSDFRLEAEMRCHGEAAIVWNHNSPIGADRPVGADGCPNRLTLSNCTCLVIALDEWRVESVEPDGVSTALGPGAVKAGDGASAGASRSVVIEQRDGRCAVAIDGLRVFDEAVGKRSGRIGVLGYTGSVCHVDRFAISDLGDVGWVSLLATDAIMGSGAAPDVWKEMSGQELRFGFG